MQRTSLSNEHGQSVVLIALVMIVLIGFMGLIIDGGQAYLTRRDSQDAADAGAYAGARVFAARTDSSSATTQAVWTAVYSYTLANRVANTNDMTAWFVDANNNNIITITAPFPDIPDGATGIRVLANESFTSGFIGVINGGGPVDIPARATVQTGVAGGAGNLMPMTIQIPVSGTFAYSPTVYTLQGDTTGPGNFQWLDYGINACGTALAGGANVVAGLLKLPPDCVSPFVNIGDWVGSKSGISPNNNIRNALDQWLLLPTSERHWIIPIYDCIGQNNQCTTQVSGTNIQYHVIEFAEFIPLGYYFGNNQHNGLTSCPNGASKCIQGYFAKWSLSSYVSTPGPCNTTGINICAMSLVE